jgi:hypothetical protein
MPLIEISLEMDEKYQALLAKLLWFWAKPIAHELPLPRTFGFLLDLVHHEFDELNVLFVLYVVGF